MGCRKQAEYTWPFCEGGQFTAGGGPGGSGRSKGEDLGGEGQGSHTPG